MLTLIRECKELDLELDKIPKAAELFGANRQQIQAVHKYYTSQEPKLKLLTFRGLGQFAQDFGVTPARISLQNLYQLFEAINWISGNSHTEVISFEKFQQILGILAVRVAKPPAVPVGDPSRVDSIVGCLDAFMSQLEASGATHRVGLLSLGEGAQTALEKKTSSMQFFVVASSTSPAQ